MTLFLLFTLVPMMLFVLQVEGYRLILHIRSVSDEVTRDIGRVERVFPNFSLRKP